MKRKFENRKSIYCTLQRADRRLQRIKILIKELHEQEDGHVPLQVKKIKWILDRM